MTTVTVFTGDSPRHHNLLVSLAAAGASVTAIVEEPNGQASTARSSAEEQDPVIREYFNRVREAEHSFFSTENTLLGTIDTLQVPKGKLSTIRPVDLELALRADFCIVFGSSIITGWLLEALMGRGAINVHIGVSPYYRGSACNFWAMYDDNYNLVGATVHLLTERVDAGGILFNDRPSKIFRDPFLFSMGAVDSVQKRLVKLIVSGEIDGFRPVRNDESLQIRYSQRKDFTKNVVRSFLEKAATGSEIASKSEEPPPGNLICPNR